MIVGFVLSTCTLNVLLASLTFPALSVAVCAVEETEAPSVLSTWSAGQLATPLVASAQVKCTVTSVVYQPFAPTVPALTAATAVGFVLSIFTVTTLLGSLTSP